MNPRLLFFLLLFSTSISKSQQFNPGSTFDSLDFQLVEIPDKRFLDLGEIFANEPTLKRQIDENLERFAQKRGFSIYVVAYAGIIGSDATTKAEAFRNNWLSNHTEGLVLVCDTDLQAMSFSLTRTDSLTLKGQGTLWKLPDHEVIEAVEALQNLSLSELSKSERLAAIVDGLLTNLEEKLAVTNTSHKHSHSNLGYLSVFFLTAGLVTALIFLSKRKDSSDLDLEDKLFFPKIEIQPRLGAQFGGGVASEICVRNSPKEG